MFILCYAAPQSVILGVSYSPPCNSTDFARKLNNALNVVCSRHPHANLLLFGHFNLPDIDWQSTIPSLVSQTEVRDFLDVCLNFNLTQPVSEPIRVTQDTANTLDQVLVNCPDSLSSITFLREISDHKVIHASFRFAPALQHKREKTIHLYDKGNYDAICEHLQNFLPFFQDTFHNRTINENWLIFKEKINNNLANRCIPKITFRTHEQKPRFNNSLKRLENKKKRMYQAAKYRTDTFAWEKYYAAERAYLSAIRKGKDAFFCDDLWKLLFNNIKKFWQVMNPQERHSVTLTNKKGETFDDIECANLFNVAFVSVFTGEFTTPPLFSRTNATSHMPTVTFFPDGILSLIDNVKLTSSAGIDNIISKLLKNTKHVTAVFLC